MGNKVIGGICFRGFWTLGIIEIVFCAVASNMQMKVGVLFFSPFRLCL